MSSRTKRILLFCLAGLLALVFALYCFAPGQIIISKTILVKINQKSLSRFLSDDDKRNKWWIDFKNTHPEVSLDLTGFKHYYLSNTISATVKAGDQLINSEINIIPTGSDSSYVKWQFKEPASGGVLKRISGIFKKNVVEEDVHEILNSLKTYTEKKENIYGFDVETQKVKDTLIAITKVVLNKYPTDSFVAGRITSLRKYLKQQHVQEKDLPMLSVQKKDNGRFETMVGIPVDKIISGNKEFAMQYMVPGDILVMQCKGGFFTISRAFREMENYMQDYGKTSPALPFEMLMTDRSKDKDTLNWLTRIYYPAY